MVSGASTRAASEGGSPHRRRFQKHLRHLLFYVQRNPSLYYPIPPSRLRLERRFSPTPSCPCYYSYNLSTPTFFHAASSTLQPRARAARSNSSSAPLNGSYCVRKKTAAPTTTRTTRTMGIVMSAPPFSPNFLSFDWMPWRARSWDADRFSSETLPPFRFRFLWGGGACGVWVHVGVDGCVYVCMCVLFRWGVGVAGVTWRGTRGNEMPH